MDKLTPEHRSDNMRRIRSTDTSAEIVVRRLVYKMGYRYRLHVGSLPGKPDLVFSRLKRIIEVRGCFWHQHGKCIDSHIPKSRVDYWEHKLKRNVQRDRYNELSLKRLGWHILVVWGCECEPSHQASLTRRLERFLEVA